MTDRQHTPCEHCEEVRLEAEDKAFAESLREGLKAPKGSLSRMVAEQYMKALFRPSLYEQMRNAEGKVVFKFWKDLTDDD